MEEKPLYQIAIERAFGRLAKATPEVQGDVILLVQNVTEANGQETAALVSRFLFPELYKS